MIAALLLAAATPNAVLPPRSAREQVKDARKIAYREGRRLWRGFDATPFRVDLTGNGREWLLCDRIRARGFGERVRDPVTGCLAQSRRRVLPEGLQAAFDIDGVGRAIAIDLPDMADVSATAAWRLTVLHETFHLYQATIPGYDAAVQRVRAALDAHENSWPLDHRFPYAEPKVVDAFRKMGVAALSFMRAKTPAQSHAAMTDYVDARHRAAIVCGDTNWRYYEFQVGQEGVARWTEIQFGIASGEAALVALAADRQAGLATSLTAIDQQGLGMWKRSALYVFGAIEAEMLERWRPGWRDSYRRAPFALGDQLDTAAIS